MNQGKCMSGPIKEIGIAKSYMFSPFRYELANVCHHHIALDDTELTIVNWNNRAVTASMFASATCFCIANNPVSAVGPY